VFIVNRQLGYISDEWSNHRFGVRALLNYQFPQMCTNPDPEEERGSFILLNLEGPPSGEWDIVQWGIGRCEAPDTECVPSTRDIWTYGRTPSSPGCAGKSQVLPTPHIRPSFNGGYTYQLRRTSTGGYNFSVHGETQVSPGPSAVCWTPSFISVFGETWDYGDAIGGSVSDHFNISSAKAQFSQDGAWQGLYVRCNARNAEAIFKCSNPADFKIGLWTDR
jgi:hypothetical protein